MANKGIINSAYNFVVPHREDVAWYASCGYGIGALALPRVGGAAGAADLIGRPPAGATGAESKIKPAYRTRQTEEIKVGAHYSGCGPVLHIRTMLDMCPRSNIICF